MPNQGFAELVKRAGQGDRDATGLLIEEYTPALRRHVRLILMDNRLRRVLEESDVCQSIMGQFFFGLSAGRFELDGPEQLVGLLKQMVRNKITDRARYWRAGRRDYLRNIAPTNPDQVGEPLCSGPTPSRVVEDREFLAEFESRLSDWERLILAFRRQGMNWPEISSRTGEGPEAIRKRFERALDRVGRTLDAGR
jgi:DNA-directed RNA polymerase specialized sigma24 family protein